MKIAQVQFAPWDKKYNFTVGELILKVQDAVIVTTDLGQELGHVTSFLELEPDESDKEIKPIIRKAQPGDLERLPSEDKKKEALAYCQELVEKYKLPMKLVDVRYALDGGRITFAFVSDNRVDFRQLVKDLTAHFNSNIRLNQIGSRDEARACGDCGHCGRDLCCKGFIKEFSSITSEMAEAQQVVHRGSDRISGACGRLMCCLSYEYDGYRELAKKLPPIGARVNVDGKRGEVIGWHVLKQSVDVKFKGEREHDYLVVEVDLNRHEKEKQKDKKNSK
jgi:cell fate regulator YaaT (PSP1 superfamily)